MGKILRFTKRKTRTPKEALYLSGEIRVARGFLDGIPRVEVMTNEGNYSGAEVSYANYKNKPLNELLQRRKYWNEFEVFRAGYIGRVPDHPKLDLILRFLIPGYKGLAEKNDSVFEQGTKSREEMVANVGKEIKFPLEYLVIS